MLVSAIMDKASYTDLYETLSYTLWKTGLEVIRELEGQGKPASHMRGIMYIHLSEWEDEGLIKARNRPLTPEQMAVGLTMPQREYRRTSTGTPKKLSEGGLEGCLVPT